MAFASAEDARIKAGGGAVKRIPQQFQPTQSKLLTTADLAKNRRALAPGGDIVKQMLKVREAQKPLREQIEKMVVEAYEKDMRWR